MILYLASFSFLAWVEVKYTFLELTEDDILAKAEKALLFCST